MNDEIKEMILLYLANMADLGDHEAQQLFNIISSQEGAAND
jgi:hypothetical protein